MKLEITQELPTHDCQFVILWTNENGVWSEALSRKADKYYNWNNGDGWTTLDYSLTALLDTVDDNFTIIVQDILPRESDYAN